MNGIYLTLGIERLAVVVAIGVAAACGSSDDKSFKTNPPPATISATATATPIPEHLNEADLTTNGVPVEEDPLLEKVTKLPEIDKVDILAVHRKGFKKPDCTRSDIVCSEFGGKILASKTLSGDDAKKIAGLWRKLRHGNGAACFSPAYVLRFYQKRKLLLMTDVCFHCCNVTLPGITSICGDDQAFRTFEDFVITQVPFPEINKDRILLFHQRQALTTFPLEGLVRIVLGFTFLRMIGKGFGHAEAEVIDLHSVIAVHDVGGFVAAGRFVDVHHHHAVAVLSRRLVAFHNDAVVCDVAKLAEEFGGQAMLFAGEIVGLGSRNAAEKLNVIRVKAVRFEIFGGFHASVRIFENAHQFV